MAPQKKTKSASLGVKIDDLYHVTLEYMGTDYTGKGKTLSDALEDLDTPKKIIRGGVFVLIHGEKKIVKVVSALLLKKIVSKPLMRVQYAKMFTNF